MLIFVNPKSEYLNPKQYLNTKQVYYNVFTNGYVMMNLFKHLLHETLKQVQGDDLK